MIQTAVKRLKWIALLEGVSFLLLLGVAVPLKYVWGQPLVVRYLGMVHGLLFVLYVLRVIQNKVELGWATGRTLLAIVLSFVPFGTFYVVRNMLPTIVANAASRNPDNHE